MAGLNGQVAIVTGGGRGIGRAIATALAAEGAAVTVMARTAEQLGETMAAIEAVDGTALAISPEKMAGHAEEILKNDPNVLRVRM